ncbi:integrase catalytic domain-containing protein [Nephila pilipes]|uniref:Integrase catalytic domain-containing protein n=1 Tax=Nephila pilipes TaxID=299642 RepID=A0A8X6R0H0_NEPPI|nr:integrase catalytic domain-containing protein [Nephila pilipes]
MYVDDWITGQDTREEALLISLHAENIMKEAGMEMRKWISKDTTLMSQWAAKGFDTYPVDTSVSLGSNKTKVLGLGWKTLDDCLTFDTKGLLEFISNNKNTERFLLQAIGKIFDPLGLISPFTLRMKCLVQELWKNKIAWDEDLTPKIAERGLSADSLLSDDKWWNGPSFLQFDELPGTDSECPEHNEEEYLSELKSKNSKENVVQTLNLN